MSSSSKHPSAARRGFLLTTTIAAAAGLVGAALIYLRKRGVNPTSTAKKAGSRAKSAAAILSGESKQAYGDVRQIIVERMIASERPITKALVLASIKEILQSLKKREAITKAEFAELATTLKADWQSLIRDARSGGKDEEAL